MTSTNTHWVASVAWQIQTALITRHAATFAARICCHLFPLKPTICLRLGRPGWPDGVQNPLPSISQKGYLLYPNGNIKTKPYFNVHRTRTQHERLRCRRADGIRCGLAARTQLPLTPHPSCGVARAPILPGTTSTTAAVCVATHCAKIHTYFLNVL